MKNKLKIWGVIHYVGRNQPPEPPFPPVSLLKNLPRIFKFSFKFDVVFPSPKFSPNFEPVLLLVAVWPILPLLLLLSPLLLEGARSPKPPIPNPVNPLLLPFAVAEL